MTITKEQKRELQSLVANLNNHPANVNVDHLTFTAFFDTEEEFSLHIDKLERNIAAYVKGNVAGQGWQE